MSIFASFTKFLQELIESLCQFLNMPAEWLGDSSTLLGGLPPMTLRGILVDTSGRPCWAKRLIAFDENSSQLGKFAFEITSETGEFFFQLRAKKVMLAKHTCAEPQWVKQGNCVAVFTLGPHPTYVKLVLRDDGTVIVEQFNWQAAARGER